MAQTGYTPILIYSSSTAAAAPVAGSLTNSTLGSELAINITDGKLFYKDNANAVQVIAWKTTPTTAGGTGLTSYTVGDILYYASGTTLTKLAIGASGRWLGSSGTAPQWNAPAALTKTDDTNVTLTLGGSASTALLNAASLTLGWTGTLATTRGGTGLSSYTANGVVYASSTSALATGSILTFDGTTLNSAKLGLTSTSAGALVDLATLTNANNTTNTETGLFFAPTTATGNIRGARISAFQVTGNNDIGLRFYTGNGATIAVAQTMWPTGGVSIGDTTDPGAGNLRLGTGNLVIGTSGKGIDFSATAGTGTSELLADYEEGTWTPVLAFGGGTTGITYTSRDATYTKVGRLVRVTCKIVLSNKGSSTGDATITGLPFSSGADSFSNNIIDTISAMANLTAGGAIFGGLGESDSTIYLLVYGTVNRATINQTYFQNTSQFSLDLTYSV